MNYVFTGKNIAVTQGIKEYTEKKLDTIFNKFTFIEKNTEIKVLVRTYTVEQKIEVTARTKGLIVRAEAKDKDLYVAIDKVAEKLKDQLRRYKTKNKKKKRKMSISDACLAEIINPAEDVKTKSIVLKSMNLDEAIARMELLGHDFFLYKDDETKKAAVVYKRKDGGYGLIETE